MTRRPRRPAGEAAPPEIPASFPVAATRVASRRGLSLRQALRLTVAPELWDTYVRDGADALPEAWEALSAVMARGTLVARGRRADAAEAEPIDAAAWASHVHPDMDADALQVDGIVFAEVAIRDPMDLPDFPARLAGRPIVEAFADFVTASPALRASLHGVDGSLVTGMARPYAFDCGATLDGRGPLPSGAWPVRLDHHDIARSWMIEPEPFANVRREVSIDALGPIDRAAAHVVRRVARFMTPIRSGAVELHGRHVRSGVLDRVDLAALAAFGAAFDMAAGALGVERDGTFVAEWSALELRAPDAPPRVQATARAIEVKARTATSEVTELESLRAEVERLEKELAYFRASVRDRDKTRIKWDFALDQVFMMIYMGHRFEKRDDFTQLVLDQIASDHGEKNPEQLYRLMRDYYPQFWRALKR